MTSRSYDLWSVCVFSKTNIAQDTDAFGDRKPQGLPCIPTVYEVENLSKRLVDPASRPTTNISLRFARQDSI